MLASDIKQKTTRGFAWSALETWFSQLLSFAGLIVLTRMLSPIDFGVVASASIVIAISQVFVHQGFADALIQISEPRPTHYSSVFWLNMAAAVIFSLGIFFASGPIAAALHAPGIRNVLEWLSPIFIIQAASKVHEARLRRELNFRSLALRRSIAALVGVGLGIVSAFAGLGAISLVVQQLAIEIVGSVILWLNSDWRPKLSISWLALRELLHFSLSILGLSLLTFINTRTDDLTITFKLGSAALGIYSVGYSILRALNNAFNGIVLRVAFPAFCRARNDLELLESSFSRSLKLTAYIGYPCFAVIIILARDIVLLAFGSKWLASVPVLQILAISAFTQIPISFAMILLRAVGKPHWNLLYLCAVSLGFIIGCLAFGQHGVVAVAIVITTVNFLTLPVALTLVSKLGAAKFSWFARAIWPALTACLLAALPVLILFPQLIGWNLVLRLAACGVLFLLLYGSLMMFLDPQNTTHKVLRLFQNLLKRSLTKNPAT